MFKPHTFYGFGRPLLEKRLTEQLYKVIVKVTK
jgi:hypothetical protein